MYYFDSVVRYSEIDAKRHMTLPSVLDLLQDCCTFHSEEVGVGIDFLKNAHRAWVLSSWQVVVKRYPVMGESVRASTWPYDFKKFIGYRNFNIEDARGEVIVWANSVWAYVDTESGRPARVPEEVEARYPLNSPYDMEYSNRKICVPEEMEEKDAVRVVRSQIDTNRHMNNSKYVMMAEEYLPEGFCVKELRAEYKKAAVLSDQIYPKVGLAAHKVTVSLEDKAGKPYAVVEFLESC